MIRTSLAATIVLAAVTVHARAQSTAAAPPAATSARPVAVLGPTGTMYEGNNTGLQLPPESSSWYRETWAGYPPHPASVETAGGSATGRGGMGASLGTKQTGGEH